MANEVLQTKQNPGNLLASLLPTKTSKTTGSRTTTEQTQLTPEAINDVIRTMMESNQGLAAIMQGPRAGGLYNSTTASLLANDLAARVGEKAAAMSAPKTTTVNETKKEPGTQIDPRWMLGLQLASELLGGGKSGGSRSNFNLGGAIDNLFNTSFFSGEEKKKNPFDSFGTIDNYGGFGFNTQDFGNFSLDLNAGNYDYNPSSYSGGGYNPFADLSYSGSTLNSTDYNPFNSSSYNLGIGNTGLGSSGINFGFSF